MTGGHSPVLVQEVLALLHPRPGGVYLDCTVGAGGHARAILEAGAPSARLVGIDRDPEAIASAREALEQFGERVRLMQGDYRELSQLAAAVGLGQCDGIICDLGVSSLQLGDPARGFSFSTEGPLDMRMDRQGGARTARDLLHRLPEQELAWVIRTYGEERWARRIARRIVAARRHGSLETTRDLAAVVSGAVPRRYWPRRIHPATRTFQALRIAVNEELDGLDDALEAAIRLLAPAGRICVIAFHSLEDRVVKHLFRRLAAPEGVPAVRVLTRRPITPSVEEIAGNPRARSAKLRAAEREGNGHGG
jgi:16S rRNA (cytosine1402-N4)-methyltransferase